MQCPLESQLEALLHLWSAVELLSGRQKRSRLQCACWIETLPYKALGMMAPANYYFFLFSSKQTSLSSTPPLVRPAGLFVVFFGICCSPVRDV